MQLIFTGTRKVLSEVQVEIIESALVPCLSYRWHVGDCPTGVDAWVRSANPEAIVYRKQSLQEMKNPAIRSKRMIDEALLLGGEKVLLSFPDRECPNGCKPSRSFSGKGSGTWGTTAYAYHRKDFKVLVFPLVSIHPPEWYEIPAECSGGSWLQPEPVYEQLSLFSL